jgi:hypothetical protein
MRNAMVKNGATLVSLLIGMVLVLPTSSALGFGENKVLNEKPKVEINKVEKVKVDEVMLKENKVDEMLVMKPKADSDLGLLRINALGIRRINLLDEGILGEGLLGIEELD